METHLGKKLKQLLRERNISAVKFSEMIEYDFRGVYKMFRRQHFNTSLLEKISAALNHDMFQYLRVEGNSPAENKLKEKISALEKEIEFLKEIIQSLKKK
ncbi:MAG: hypothetical protein HY841_09305 [Bacteroidetes bacterium]|nr:hypothetical protein [Bacteroidota bacterium]